MLIDNELPMLILNEFPTVNYSPAVFIVRNEENARLILDIFKAKCKNKNIKLIDGCKIITCGKTDIIETKNSCVIFENIQFISGSEHYQSNFFHLYNFLHLNSIPIIITLNDDIHAFDFEGRIKARLFHGIKDEII